MCRFSFWGRGARVGVRGWGAGNGDVMVLSSHGQQHIDVISREHRRPKMEGEPLGKLESLCRLFVYLDFRGRENGRNSSGCSRR